MQSGLALREQQQADSSSACGSLPCTTAQQVQQLQHLQIMRMLVWGCAACRASCQLPVLPAASHADTARAVLLTPQEEARLREMAIREEKTKELLRNKDGLGPAAKKKSVKAPWGSPGSKGNAASLSMERLNHYQAACDKVMQGTGAQRAGSSLKCTWQCWVATEASWIAWCQELGLA